MSDPICSKCNMPTYAGEIVEKQNGPHVLCADPALLNHTRIIQERSDGTLEFGYIDDNGKEVWL